MRLAEREMIEIDRKQQAIESAQTSIVATASTAAAGGGGVSTTTSSTSGGSNKPEGHSTLATVEETITTGERMIELVKQIAEESRKLAATRAELQKAKKQYAELGENEKSGKSQLITAFTTSGAGASSSTSGAGKKTKTPTTSTSNETTTSTNETTTEVAPHKGVQKMSVPESLIPELCR